MPVVTPDIVKNHELIEDDNGLVLVRSYVVSELNQTTSALVQAYGHPDLPEYADVDDDFPELVCRNLAFRPFAENSRTMVRVMATFRPPDFGSTISPIIRFSAFTRDVPSHFDAETGERLDVRYLATTAEGNQTHIINVGERRDGRRCGLLEIERVEPDLPNLAKTYNGALNLDTWQGETQLKWYCREVAFEKVLYRAGYRVFYAFEFDPETHIETLVYRNALGLVPNDIQTPVDKTVLLGNGWRNAARGKRFSFAALALPVVFT